MFKSGQRYLAELQKAAASFKEVYEECYEIFKRQVAQPGLLFNKRV